MKKLSLLALFVLILPLTALAENLAPPVNAWGTGRAEIMALYDADPVRNNDYLTYNITDILGMEAQIHYGFTKDDELAFVSYGLYAAPAASTVYIGNYDAVKQLLKTRYGRPEADNIYWFGDKADRAAERDIGAALIQQAVRFETGWSLPEAWLELDMKGQGKEVVINVRYISNDLGSKFFKGVQNR